MKIDNRYYRLCINEQTGAIDSFANEEREFLWLTSTPRPLFTIRFRSKSGTPLDVTALEAATLELHREETHAATTITLDFRHLAEQPIDVSVTIKTADHDPLTYWNLAVTHDTDHDIEWIDFPNIVVPNDLVAAGGDAHLLWPAVEGVLIDDAHQRNRTGYAYKPMDYPSKGWEGLYPGPCTTQFMAYYDRRGGVYLGAHDARSHVKAIEYYPHDEGIRLEYRLYPGAPSRGTYAMDYDMVLGVFRGDWYDAAAIYRDWLMTSRLPLLAKLYENAASPPWFNHSPVIVIYPVRGHTDTGDMSPNEYFPYTNALPILERLADAFGAPVMALLMHWEGTAPWAPPYVWPPFGGEEMLTRFIEQMHEQGHLVGLYCSGIGWTQESLLTEYTGREQFEREGLASIMCASPAGALPYSLICGGAQRWGYDMCPTAPFVEEVVASEISKIAQAGCDYIQFFDQNLGGTSYFCYSREHGHPPAPGLWQVEAMTTLYAAAVDAVHRSGRATILGCESAAAEPYMRYLPFNDLRYLAHFSYGTPVPLYGFLYHEYITNFMGNQNAITQDVDCLASPENLSQRLAYSFVAGDMLSVVLKDAGQLHWGWMAPWEMAAPAQEPLIHLIRTLNTWRKQGAHEYLCFGRMEKPYQLQSGGNVPMIRVDGSRLPWPPVMTSRWRNRAGRCAQIIVNYRTVPEECALVLPGMNGRQVQLTVDPTGARAVRHTIENERLSLTLAPLSAMLIEFADEDHGRGVNDV